MLQLYIYSLILSIIPVNSIEIPYIDNVILEPGYTSNSTWFINQTFDQCFCLSSLSYPAMNWFPNNTCQLFLTFPPTYRILPSTGARLYFLQQILPNTSQCCMPDINYLLNKLNQATLIYANLTQPRDVLIDNFGYLVTVEMSANYLDRFNVSNLTRISRTALSTSYQMTISFSQNAYFIAPNNQNYMLVIDSGNLALLGNITMTGVIGARGIMFLNNDQTMVVTSNSNNSLVFFNRTSVSPIRYTFSFSQPVRYGGPHGLWRVNDSFFYVTSYTNSSIYSYSRTNVNTGWNETLFLNLLRLNGSGGSTSMAIDECGRFWFPTERNTVLIYSQQGILLGNYTIASLAVSFMKIMDNYVIYMSDWSSNRIVRLDPNIQC